MNLQKLFEYALQREKEGYQFFKTNADKAGHAAAGQIFQRLADEELKHIQYLQNLMKAGGDEDGEDGDEDDDDDQNSSDEEDKEEVKKADAFFESQSTPSGSKESVELFVQLTLSRPLLRGVAAMGFVKPTPIQASCIPVALSGRDICASAVTGSGKTAGKILLLVSPKSNGKIGHSSHFVSLLPSF